jgi:hypothetical protein
MGVSLGSRDAAISGRQDGLSRLIRRYVRVVTVDAVVARAVAAGRIPAAVRAAMDAAPIVPELRTVTLPAQSHDICHGDGATVGHAQRVLFPNHVTRCARERGGMLEAEPLVKLVEVSGRLWERDRSSQRVARDARDPHWPTEWIFATGLDRRELGRLVDGGAAGGCRLWPELPHSRCVRTIAAEGHEDPGEGQ